MKRNTTGNLLDFLFNTTRCSLCCVPALLPYLQNPPTNGTGSLKQYAFSQFNKANEKAGPYGVQPWDPCTQCNYSDWDYVGLSLRSDRWRYTEWVMWDKEKFLPQWGVFGTGGGPEL